MDSSTPYTSAFPSSQPMQPADRLQQQDQIIRQQDQSLEQLSRSVATLHNLGGEIHGELRAQGALLDDLERGVDQTRDALVSQQSRLQRLIRRTKDNWLFFAISAHRRRLHARARHRRSAARAAPAVLTARRLRVRFAVLLVIVLGVILYFVISSPS